MGIFSSKTSHFMVIYNRREGGGQREGDERRNGVFRSLTTGYIALRLLARPRGSRGQEEILEKRSGLAARIGERCRLGRRETAEIQEWKEFRELRGEVFVESKEGALRTAMEWAGQPNVMGTGGPRLENGAVEQQWPSRTERGG